MTTRLIPALLGAATLLLASTAPALLLASAKPARAHEAPPAGTRESVVANRAPVHPVSLLAGNEGAWSVSRTETGCFLLSATRKKASRLALGRDSTGALGLYAIDLALSTPPHDAQEPVELKLEETELHRTGRVIGNSLLFVALSQDDMDASLRTLNNTGILWLGLRGAWLSHGGQNLQAMVADYGRQCGPAPKPQPAQAAAASTAKVGSKAAAAP